MKTVDKVNKRFGRWIVLSIIEMGRKPKVLCRCDCGTEKIVLSKSLGAEKNQRSTSCGCFQKERVKKALFLGKEVAALNQYFSIYKSSAKLRDMKFKLTKFEFKNLIFKRCYYCNSPPSERKIYSTGDLIKVNGIDRIDNTKGYIINNCVPCCIVCNKIKGRVTMEIAKKMCGFKNE